MTIVDELHARFQEIIQAIPETEISLRNVASEHFRKNLLLSAASYYEKQLVSLLVQLVRSWGSNTIVLNEFVRIKAMERQYHTYFDWEKPHANKFFSLFGADFKAYMIKRCEEDDAFADAVKAFMEIGGERNRMVHQDFGNYALEKTVEEIYGLYNQALVFLPGLETCFAEFNSQPPAQPPDQTNDTTTEEVET